MYTRKRRLPVQWGWIQAAGAFAGLPVQNIKEVSIMERVYRQGRNRGGRKAAWILAVVFISLA
ncbi:MAG: hypothetical protein ACLVAW_26485, partial [Eisenbergiella massiliensis]